MKTLYYLCSLALCALTFSRAVRSHWGVENHLHWILDVVFHEELACLRTGNGPENMAIIRHTSVNLLSRAKPTISTKNRRKRAGWSIDFLEKTDPTDGVTFKRFAWANRSPRAAPACAG